MKAKEVLNKYKITRNTLYNWVRYNKISYKKTPSGRYDYFDEDIKIKEKINIIYARVSTTGQSDNLKRQIERLTNYCSSNGVLINNTYSEIASGMNYNRKYYNKIINMVLDGVVSKIFIEYEDRLCRFGFDGLKTIFEKFNTEIIIINKSDTKDNIKEITDDLVSIIHHYSSKIYSLRRNKSKIIKAINDN